MTTIDNYGPLTTDPDLDAALAIQGTGRATTTIQSIINKLAAEGITPVATILFNDRGTFNSTTVLTEAFLRNDVIRYTDTSGTGDTSGTYFYDGSGGTGIAPPTTPWVLLVARGGQFFSGSTAPASTLGKEGDAYIRDNGEFYNRGASSWSLVATLVTAASVTAAITAHEAATNPHPGYLTPSEVIGVAPITATVSGSNVQIGINLADFGQAPGYKYNWVQTAGTTPASGQAQAAATLTQGAAATLTIHDSDRDGGDVSNELNGLTTGSTIWILDEASDNNYAQFRLTADATDNTGTTTLATTCIRLQGTLPAGEVAVVIFPAGGGGGHTIQEEGVPLVQRSNLNFVGPTVTATDNAGTDTTTITIQGSDLGGGAIIPHQSTAPTTGAAEIAIYPNNSGALQTRAQNDGTIASLLRVIRSTTAPAASDRRVDTEWVDTSTGVIYRWWPEIDNGNGGWLPITANEV